MNEGTALPTQLIERVREGMTVVDAAGERLGTVAFAKTGDPRAMTTRGNEPGEPGPTGAAPLTVSGEPQVPGPLRSQLLRSGFIKVEGPGLADADRYVPGDRVGDVSADTATLRWPDSGTARRWEGLFDEVVAEGVA